MCAGKAYSRLLLSLIFKMTDNLKMMNCISLFAPSLKKIKEETIVSAVVSIRVR